MPENISDVFATNDYSFCSPDFQSFLNRANSFLTVLDLIICCVGVVTNVLNVLVYTRRHMLKPTNVILAAIALADLIVMATYIPQYVALNDSIKKGYPYYAEFVWITHEYFLAVFHHISIWLTVTLAVWRYIAVIHPFRSRELCTIRRALIVIAIIVVFNLLVTIGSYAGASIIEQNETLTWREGGCSSKYCHKFSSNSMFLRRIEFIYQGIVSKTVPCIILSFVSIRLILALVALNRERRSLLSSLSIRMLRAAGFRKRTTGEDQTSISERGEPALPPNVTQESKEFDKTTAMLTVVLAVFLITELPPSIAIVMEWLFGLGGAYYFECRRPLHYLILLMYYLSGCFNFFVYVSMSKNYRDTLLSLPSFCFMQREELHKRGNTSALVESIGTIDTRL